MARSFDVRLPLERAWTRDAMFALELLDAVTLERVVGGVKVEAIGLDGAPILNHGGLYVWLRESMAGLQKIVVDPLARPFEPAEIPAAQVRLPLHTLELRPLANYPFAPGITAIRGSLYEARVPLGQIPVPLAGATIRLEWLDDGNVFQPGTADALTSDAGDFVSILRFAPAEEPKVDLEKLSIRLFARRAGGIELSQDLKLLQGRVTDETFAWDELH
jgi:hypothetical protein